MRVSDSGSNSSIASNVETAVREAPLETTHYPIDDAYYKDVGQESDLREPYRLQREFLKGLSKHPVPEIPEAPTIVFINTRSGGRVGPALTEALRRALGYVQVFDLSTHKPDAVLAKLWENFEVEKATRPAYASEVQRRLRIVAAGGDGTVAWVLQTIARAAMSPQPHVAVIPLGTGNDLARTFGWGGAFEKKWIATHNGLYAALRRVAEAKPVALDRWLLRITAPSAEYFLRKRPYAFVPEGAAETATTHRAFSWNYVSIGMDAKAAHGFHELRENKPALAASRAANQFWYGYYSCTSGWFCGSSPLNKEVFLEVKRGERWSPVDVPESVRAIVLLNLQSYGGGRDLWQHDDAAEKKGFTPPGFNDGLIEVVGFKSGYHAGAVMSGATHAVRLSQAEGVRVKIVGVASSKGRKGKVYMQLDGEPWKQDVPKGGGGEELVVELVLDGDSPMLAAPNSTAEPDSNPDPSPTTPPAAAKAPVPNAAGPLPAPAALEDSPGKSGEAGGEYHTAPLETISSPVAAVEADPAPALTAEPSKSPLEVITDTTPVTTGEAGLPPVQTSMNGAIADGGEKKSDAGEGVVVAAAIPVFDAAPPLDMLNSEGSDVGVAKSKPVPDSK